MVSEETKFRLKAKEYFGLNLNAKLKEVNQENSKKILCVFLY